MDLDTTIKIFGVVFAILGAANTWIHGRLKNLEQRIEDVNKDFGTQLKLLETTFEGKLDRLYSRLDTAAEKQQEFRERMIKENATKDDLIAMGRSVAQQVASQIRLDMGRGQYEKIFNPKE